MLAAWHVADGDRIAKGQEIADIETSKIANAFESPGHGHAAAAAGRARARRCRWAPCWRRRRRVGRRTPRSTPSSQDFQEKLRSSSRPRPRPKGPEPETVEAGGRRLRYLEAGDGGGRRPSSSSTASAATSTTGCSTSRPLAEQPHHLRPRPAGPWRLEQGGGRGDVGVAGRGRRAASWTPWGSRRRIWSATRWAGRSPRAGALPPRPRSPRSTLVCPAGLGPDISMEYIDGFIERQPGARS